MHEDQINLLPSLTFRRPTFRFPWVFGNPSYHAALEDPGFLLLEILQNLIRLGATLRPSRPKTCDGYQRLRPFRHG